MDKPQSNDNMETEDCEDFDIRDLDEREPCQTMQDTMLVDSRRHKEKSQKQMGMVVPLTTRSTQSAAIIKTKQASKQGEQVNNAVSANDGTSCEIPAYNMELHNTSRYDAMGSARGLSMGEGSPRSSAQIKAEIV